MASPECVCVIQRREYSVLRGLNIGGLFVFYIVYATCSVSSDEMGN